MTPPKVADNPNAVTPKNTVRNGEETQNAVAANDDSKWEDTVDQQIAQANQDVLHLPTDITLALPPSETGELTH